MSAVLSCYENHISHMDHFSDAVLCCTQMVVSMAHKIKLLFFFCIIMIENARATKKQLKYVPLELDA